MMGLDERYNPCSFFPITTLKWRFEELVFGIYNITNIIL